MRYYYVIILIIGFIFSEQIYRNGFFLSLGSSDIAVKMGDLTNEEIELTSPSSNYSLSIGYNRTDPKGIRSGVGAQYIMGYDRVSADISSAYYKDWFGIGLLSFFNIPIIKYKNISILEIGARSHFDLGFSNNNFSFGPSVGISVGFYSLRININYFRGCLDFINFDNFSDQINLEIYFSR